MFSSSNKEKILTKEYFWLWNVKNTWSLSVHSIKIRKFDHDLYNLLYSCWGDKKMNTIEAIWVYCEDRQSGFYGRVANIPRDNERMDILAKLIIEVVYGGSPKKIKNLLIITPDAPKLGDVDVQKVYTIYKNLPKDFYAYLVKMYNKGK